jgi:hypothetical protein
MQNRSIMTGALRRPSLFNRPLPRLKPQAIHISRMIWNRRRVRDLRLKNQELWASWRDDLRRESAFEANPFRTVQENGLWFEKVFENNKGWRFMITTKNICIFYYNQLVSTLNVSQDVYEHGVRPAFYFGGPRPRALGIDHAIGAVPRNSAR